MSTLYWSADCQETYGRSKLFGLDKCAKHMIHFSLITDLGDSYQKLYSMFIFANLTDLFVMRLIVCRVCSI